MYTKVAIPPGTPTLVRAVVASTIDPRLEDVHAMLRLPLDGDGLRAGCNFAIADTLFGVIEGVSAVLSPRYGGATDAFLNCVKRYYQPEREQARTAGVSLDELATLLSARYRNPMQHALGLALGAPDAQGIRWPQPFGDTLFVFRDKHQLGEVQLFAMENEKWASFLDRPTLGRDGGRLYLSVEAFYVGTRRLVSAVLADEEQMRFAEQALENLVGVQKLSPSTSHLSGARIPQPTMVQSGATLTAQTSSQLPSELWDGERQK